MKYLMILTSLISLESVMAQSISSECLRSSSRYMSRMEGINYCDNVANNCFVALKGARGFYEARERCLNIASSCFGELSKITCIDNSIKYCQDVSNSCYQAYRADHYSVRESIRKCRAL